MHTQFLCYLWLRGLSRLFTLDDDVNLFLSTESNFYILSPIVIYLVNCMYGTDLYRRKNTCTLTNTDVILMRG